MKRLVRAVIALTIGSALIAGLWVFATTISSSSNVNLTPQATVSCPDVAAAQVGAITVPAGPVAGYCQDKLVNAAHIMNAARDLGVGVRTQAIGVMTAIGESGLVNINYGDAAGADSRGLFQQRDNGAWGTLADRMDPYIAATNFFSALMRLPDWVNLSPTEAAHSVQVNADPNYYSRYWSQAQEVVTALSGAQH